MMSCAPSDFFDLATSKLDWIDARAALLAGNVANADTPGYQARDLAPFSSFLSHPALALSTTNEADLPGNDTPDFDAVAADGAEVAPDGNGISIDGQMRMIAANDQDQNAVTTLYRKYVGMTDIALGVSG